MSEFEVVEVAASDTFPLRREVLGQRPDEPNLADMARPDDDHPDSGHFAIFDEGRVVATGTVRRQAAPWLPDEAGFRIRGMAVDPAYRRDGGKGVQGLGSTVLAAIMLHVADPDRGGGILWCDARVGAQTLYQQAGFQTHGEPTFDESSGWQVEMYRQVP